MSKKFVIPPDTEENRTLVDNVHPPGWTNPVPAERYNLVVVGAGTAGLVTAAGAAGLGAKVALIEREFMGGDCLNVGCVPSKGIIRPARAIHDASGRAGRPVTAVNMASVTGSLFEADLGGSVALVMGREHTGLGKGIASRCDDLVSLPMRGVVTSLNVSVATGICLYEIIRQRR